MRRNCRVATVANPELQRSLPTANHRRAPAPARKRLPQEEIRDDEPLSSGQKFKHKSRSVIG